MCICTVILTSSHRNRSISRHGERLSKFGFIGRSIQCVWVCVYKIKSLILDSYRSAGDAGWVWLCQVHNRRVKRKNTGAQSNNSYPRIVVRDKSLCRFPRRKKNLKSPLVFILLFSWVVASVAGCHVLSCAGNWSDLIY